MGFKDLFSIFNKSSNKNSNDSFKSLDNIEKLIEQNKISDAEEKLKKYLINNTQDSKAFEMLGLMLLKQNKYDESIDNLSKAIKLNYSLTEAYKNILTAILKSEQYKKGEKFFKFIIKNNSEHAYSYFALARIYEFIPDFELFKRSLDKAIRLNNQEALAWKNNNIFESYNNISESLIKNKKYKELIDFIEKNIDSKNDLNINNTKINLAVAYKEIGRLAKAESIFKELILNSKSRSISQAFYHLSIIFEATNREDESKLLLEIAEGKDNYDQVYQLLKKQIINTSKTEISDNNLVNSLDNNDNFIFDDTENSIEDLSQDELGLNFKSDNKNIINHKYIVLITKKDFDYDLQSLNEKYKYEYLNKNNEKFLSVLDEVLNILNTGFKQEKVLNIVEKIYFVNHIILFDDINEVNKIVEKLILENNGFVLFNNEIINNKFETYLSNNIEQTEYLFEYENAVSRRNKNNLIIQSRNILIDEKLPTTISENEAIFKNYDDIANKAFLYYYSALKTKGSISESEFNDLIKKQGIDEDITLSDSRFIKILNSDNKTHTLEFLKVMLWSMKIIFNIGFPDKEITIEEITKVLEANTNNDSSSEKVLRSEKEILDHLDLMYRLKSHIDSEKQKDNSSFEVTINENVVNERLNALKWIAGYNI